MNSPSDPKTARDSNSGRPAYMSRPIPTMAPESLARASWLAGGPRPSLERARLLDLGCGDGSHLIALAAHRPRCTFFGVDVDAQAIERGRGAARELGLRNLTLRPGDLSTASLPDELDFVTAHGVYSWIDAERRRTLLERAAKQLAPGGLLAVSFNAMPGWGLRGRIRDVLGRGGPTLEDARHRSVRLEAIVADAAQSAPSAWAGLLAEELARASDASDSYLAHEYLAAHNDAFWLSEVVGHAAPFGLRYIEDAQVCAPEGRVPAELRERVAPLQDDPIAREELVDLVMRRQLRAAIFAHADAPGTTPPSASDPEPARFFGALRAERDPFDATEGVEERFRGGPADLEVQVSSSLSKIALLVLSSSYPNAWSADALEAEACARLQAMGLAPGPGAETSLREGLLRLVEHGALELRLTRGSLRSEPGPRPAAHALTRWEASRSDAVTTPIHTSLPMDPVDRALLTRLDGSRTPAEAAEAVLEAITEGQLELEGAPASPFRMRPELEARAERLVATLGWWGLVE